MCSGRLSCWTRPARRGLLGADADWLDSRVRDGVLEPARKPLSLRSLPNPARPARPTSIVAALQADRER